MKNPRNPCHGDPAKLRPRAPRLAFNEARTLL